MCAQAANFDLLHPCRPPALGIWLFYAGLLVVFAAGFFVVIGGYFAVFVGVFASSAGHLGSYPWYVALVS